jgi:hypothetical protein
MTEKVETTEAPAPETPAQMTGRIRRDQEKKNLVYEPKEMLKYFLGNESDRQAKAFRQDRLRWLLRGALMMRWAKREFVTYVELAEPFGLFSGGTIMASALGEIMEEDVAEGGGLLSTLVIGQSTGIPGSGYFGKAASIGIFDPGKESQFDFWLRQADFLGLKDEAAEVAKAAGWVLPTSTVERELTSTPAE